MIALFALVAWQKQLVKLRSLESNSDAQPNGAVAADALSRVALDQLSKIGIGDDVRGSDRQ
jgi:hypothetical protein